MTERRKKKRLDYQVLHTVGDKVLKEDSDVFRSVSSSPTKSSEEESEADTTFENTELEDYQHVDDPFNEELSNLSVRFENINMANTERLKLLSVQEALCEDIQDYIEENTFTEKLS